MAKRSYNKVQETYMLAKAHLEVLQQQEREIEQKYIADHDIVNPDGSIPRASWAIDDDATCETAMAECSKIVQESGLWAEIVEARKLLNAAEKDLLAYGLSIVPKREKQVLEKAVEEDYTVRKKVIDLVLKLDARTVRAI
jgi:oligoribonuclease (3'-5' exoribonuclease)